METAYPEQTETLVVEDFEFESEVSAGDTTSFCLSREWDQEKATELCFLRIKRSLIEGLAMQIRNETVKIQ